MGFFLMEFPDLQMLEEIVEVVSLFPQEHLQQGIHNQSVDVAVPLIWEKSVRW